MTMAAGQQSAKFMQWVLRVMRRVPNASAVAEKKLQALAVLPRPPPDRINVMYGNSKGICIRDRSIQTDTAT